MSPRGVAIRDVHERLFEAADRLLERDGPAGLTSRAVTSEAHTATGLLFRHFIDFDAFLAAFVIDRMQRFHGSAGGWVNRAGTASVTENLTDVALSLLPAATRLFEVAHARPSLMNRLMETHHAAAGAGLEEIERAITGYLDAEKSLGRVRADADTASVALALAASVHEMSIRHLPHDAKVREGIRRVVNALATPILA